MEGRLRAKRVEVEMAGARGEKIWLKQHNDELCVSNLFLRFTLDSFCSANSRKRFVNKKYEGVCFSHRSRTKEAPRIYCPPVMNRAELDSAGADSSCGAS